MEVARVLLMFLVPYVALSTTSQYAMSQTPRKIVEVEGITEYRLDNGLKLLLFPDSSQPTVTVNMTVFVGSRHEGYGEAGMAHLLEHMLFKGTPTRSAIPKLLQDRGAQFNGTTSVDRTNFYETLPAEGDNLEFAIALEADRLVNSTVRGEDLASEMTVVRNEFERGENQPLRVLQQRMQSAAFDWHNYGQSTIGNRSDIERVPITNLREFYQKHYRVDNTMVIIAGKFETKEALELVQKYFGSIPKPAGTLDRTYTEEPAQDGERTVVVRRVGDVSWVGAAYHIPSGPHPDYAPLSVAAGILGTEPSGRLYKQIKEPGIATSVIASLSPQHDPGLLYVYAEVPEDNSIEDARRALIDAAESFGREEVTEEEVSRAKLELLNQYEKLLSNTQRLALRLSESASQGDWRLFFLGRDRIEEVTPEDVQRVASQYLVRNNRTVGLYIPTDKPQRVSIPTTPPLDEMLAGLKKRDAVAAGEQFDPSLENIESRTTRGELSNGIDVAYLPKKTKGQTVIFTIALRYGNADTLTGQSAAAALLPQLMTRGTQGLTFEEIDDIKTENQASLSASGYTKGLLFFEIQTKREYLVPMLDLLTKIMREPALAEEEFELLMNETLTQLTSQLNDPRMLAYNQFRRLVRPHPKDDPRYVPTVAEEVERYSNVTVEQVRELYENLLGAQAGEIVVVGDFDVEEVSPAINRMLSDWTTDVRYSRLPDPSDTALKAETIEISTPDKENAVYVGGLTFPMRDSDPDYPALVIGNFILGGGSLSSRLGNRVRQDEGLSYGVGSGLSAHPIDKRCDFQVVAITAPQNRDKLVDVIREELELLLREGITADELEVAKTGYLQKQQVNRASRDSSVAELLRNNLFCDRTLQFDIDFENSIRGLTVDQVNSALRKHVDLDRFNTITAGDFSKVEQ